MINYLLAGLLAYLISSISPSVWLGKLVFKRDLRAYGSKNPGASNATYVFGFAGGAAVLLLDVFKGFASLLIADRLFAATVPDQHLLLFVATFFAVLGHCKSIFLGFKGGKGFATFIGAILYHFPAVTGILIIGFALTVLVTKFIVMGTFMMITSVPLVQFYLHTQQHHLSVPAMIAMLATSLFILYRHRENIVKLLNGTEISIKTPRISDKELKG